MTVIQELLASVDAYCRKHSVTRARVGELVMSDNKFFSMIEDGRGVTARTLDRFRTALRKDPQTLRDEYEARGQKVVRAA